MLKRDVREMVSYLVGERKSFKVTFANGKVEVVEYRGYCWVLGNKGYTDEELVKKMVRFQDNVSKFIIRLEVIEEEVEEVVVDEESSVEEVENLTDDLFQDEDLAYCEEAIERESNVSRETNNIKEESIMTNKEMEEKKYLEYIDERVYHCLERGIDKKQIAEWLDDYIYDLPADSSSELFNTLYRIQDNLLYGNEF